MWQKSTKIWYILNSSGFYITNPGVYWPYYENIKVKQFRHTKAKQRNKLFISFPYLPEYHIISK